MFLSTTNCARYEYQHYSRYGTLFSSIDEYKTWKTSLWPTSRVAFSMIELGIKMWYFVKSFPLEMEFQNACDVGISIFNIHIVLLLLTYSILGSCSFCVMTGAYCYGMHHTRSRHIFRGNGGGVAGVGVGAGGGGGRSGGVGVGVGVGVDSTVIELTADSVTNEECCICICMDVDNTQTWVVLPCAHRFHRSCIWQWFVTRHTCPVCRLDMTGQIM